MLPASRVHTHTHAHLLSLALLECVQVELSPVYLDFAEGQKVRSLQLHLDLRATYAVALDGVRALSVHNGAAAIAVDVHIDLDYDSHYYAGQHVFRGC